VERARRGLEDEDMVDENTAGRQPCRIQDGEPRHATRRTIDSISCVDHGDNIKVERRAYFCDSRRFFREAMSLDAAEAREVARILTTWLDAQDDDPAVCDCASCDDCADRAAGAVDLKGGN